MRHNMERIQDRSCSQAFSFNNREFRKGLSLCATIFVVDRRILFCFHSLVGFSRYFPSSSGNAHILSLICNERTSEMKKLQSYVPVECGIRSQLLVCSCLNLTCCQLQSGQRFQLDFKSKLARTYSLRFNVENRLPAR